MAESGLPGYEADVWYGLFVPRATPPEVVSRLAADARRVLLEKSGHEKFVALGVDPYEERICTLDVGFAGSGLVEVCRTSSGVHVREVEAM